MRRLLPNFVAAWFGSLLFVAALFVIEVRAQDKSQPSPTSSLDGNDGVVVMRDGGVLVGNIKQAGDRYVVTRAGGEIQVAASSVMLTSPTLRDAYQQQRDRISVPTAVAHLKLAQWCLRNDLLPQAQLELDAARQLEPANPALLLLDRRLAKANAAPGGTNASQPTTVKPVSTQQPHVDIPLPVDVSHEVVEAFTRRVQPVLVNNCTTSGCHQPGGKESFQLDRALLRGLANRRSTMRNLTATLALVNRENPELSPLLKVPRQSHGGMENPIFGPRQQQAYEHLVNWVALVTKREATGDLPAATEANDTEQPQPLNQPRAPAEEESTDDTRAAAIRAGVSPAAFSLIQRELKPKTQTAQPQLRYGSQLKAWTPRDPFDAEIFNRKTQKAEAAPAESVTEPTENRTPS